MDLYRKIAIAIFLNVPMSIMLLETAISDYTALIYSLGIIYILIEIIDRKCNVDV